MEEIVVKEHHVELLTQVLVKAVEMFKSSIVERGHKKICDTVERMEIEDVVKDLQKDEKETDEKGRLNPNLVGCVRRALEFAIMKNTGKGVYDGLNERILSYDKASEEIKKTKFDKDGIPALTDKNLVSIGGTTSLHDIWSIGMMGHDLRNTLGQLNEDMLRDAAKEVILADLKDMHSFVAREKRRTPDPKTIGLN